jgi:phage/plasmid-associated DNA primase
MELIPDDKPVKLFFDADYKYTDNFDGFNVQNANDILRLNQLYLTQYCVDMMKIKPVFATAESHYKSKIVDGVEKWAYSFHIVIPNILAFKKDILEMGKELNEFIQKDQLQYSHITQGDKYNEFVEGGIKEAFDLSVYKTGMQKFRCVNSSKDGENRPFNLIQGTNEDMVITANIPSNAIFYKPPTVETPIVKTITPSILTNTDKKYEMLCANMCLDKGLFFADSKETTKWLEMGLFIKGYFGDSLESYALFDKFSQLGGSSYTQSDNKDRWDGFATNEKYDNFGIFVNKAKKYDKVKYKEIDDEIKVLKKNNKLENKKNKQEVLEVGSLVGENLVMYRKYIKYDLTTDNGGMNFIIDSSKDKFLWIKKEMFCWTGKRWEIGHLEFIRYTTTVGCKLLEDILVKAKNDGLNGEMLVLLNKSVSNAIKQFKQLSFQKKMIEESEAFLTRDDVVFDANPDIIGFNNGVYDLIKHEFRETKYNDYITMSCGYDYNPTINPEKLREVEDLLNKIIPNGENKQLLLEIMSAGLTGRAIEKFVMFNGGGRNGKGLLNEFLKTIFGDYQLIYANVSLLTEKEKTGANPEKASIHNKRIVIMKEPDGNEPIRNDRVKDITGGGNISGRMCFSNNTNINLNLILIMECNERPKFKSEPTHAEEERTIDLLFPNRFTTLDDEIDDISVFKADGIYKTTEWKEDHRNEFLHLIIQAFKKFQNNNYIFKIPQNVKERTQSYLNLSFPILEIFNDLYETTNGSNDIVKLKDVYDNVKHTDTFYGFDKAEKRKYNYKYFCDFIEKNREFRGKYHDIKKIKNIKYNNILIGYKLKNTEETISGLVVEVDDNETVDYNNMELVEM